jgi:lipoprotein-releasing system permease protein
MHNIFTSKKDNIFFSKKYNRRFSSFFSLSLFLSFFFFSHSAFFIMSFYLLFSIARTHLFAKKKQTITATLGVTFGIGMFILMISVMTGVNDYFTSSMLESTAHIRMYNDVQSSARLSLLEESLLGTNEIASVERQKPKNIKLSIRNALQIIESLKSEPNVVGVSPQIHSQVFYNYGAVQLNGSIAGVNILEEDKLFDIAGKLQSGALENLLAASNGIIMGAGLAKKLNARLGDRVQITTPFGATMTLKIVGTFATGNAAIDNVKSYATLSTAQKILQRDASYITAISVNLGNLTSAKKTAAEFQARYGVTSEDWETANAVILQSFVIRNIMTYVVVTTLLVVAGFGIYNIMSMTINDKMKDIAILKATGFASRDIVGVFMLQAIAVGVAGSLLGLCIGGSLAFWVSQIPVDFGEFSTMTRFPVNFLPQHYLTGVLFGVGATCLAGFLPSRKAGKVDPVSIIRG